MADGTPADDAAGAHHATRTPIADRIAALERAEQEKALQEEADLDALLDRAEGEGAGIGFGIHLSFRSRLTLGLVAAAVLPLAGFGVVALVTQGRILDDPDTLGRVLLLALVIAALIGILLAYLLAADLIGPLRAIASAVDRVSAGDLSTPIEVPGDDEPARLAVGHNRLAATLERRNRELGQILEAIERASPRDGAEFVAARAAMDARAAFGMVDCEISLVDPAGVALGERIPGEALPVRAVLQTGEEELGVLVGHLPATRTWEPADQDLLQL